jgi:hypothetical protein
MKPHTYPTLPETSSDYQADILGKTPDCPPLPPEPIGTSAPKPPRIPIPTSYQHKENCRIGSINHVYTIGHSQAKLMQMIRMIKNMPKLKPVNPPFKFECSKAAALHNWTIISKFGSLENTIRAFPYSPIHYGSEFKPPCILDPILKHHKYWPRLKDMLANGSQFPLEKHDENLRQADLEMAVAYGNHKSAENNIDTLISHVTKEISKGWIVPLLPNHAKQLDNAMISPIGVVSQSTINDRGEIIPSNRVTHDLSFPGKLSGLSINSRTNMELLETCQYGHMLVRTIHYIVALRLAYPYLPIVLQKIDFKSAYRRQHLNAATAVQCMSSAMIKNTQFAFLNLRLSFGGSACPSEWCVISETITDLANMILNDEHWDPQSLFPDLLEKVPPSTLLDETIPMAKGKPLLVDIPLESVGKEDVYIDDVCTIGLFSRENERKLRSAVLLAMETVSRPISNSEQLPRDPFPSMDKLLSEADLTEEKCLLG